jgi:hypothetical protein
MNIWIINIDKHVYKTFLESESKSSISQLLGFLPHHTLKLKWYQSVNTDSIVYNQIFLLSTNEVAKADMIKVIENKFVTNQIHPRIPNC